MSLTTQQLATLRAGVFADPTAAALLAAGNWQEVRDWLNAMGTAIVWRSSVAIAEVGRVTNYIAVEAMTDANRGRINTFYLMNPVSIDPSRSDMRTYWANTFSGALGGQGQATRDALEALWRRTATRAERLLATGTGTQVAPATLGLEGEVDDQSAIRIVYKDDGVTIWTPGG
jgi:hypothetical protein